MMMIRFKEYPTFIKAWSGNGFYTFPPLCIEFVPMFPVLIISLIEANMFISNWGKLRIAYPRNSPMYPPIFPTKLEKVYARICLISRYLNKDPNLTWIAKESFSPIPHLPSEIFNSKVDMIKNKSMHIKRYHVIETLPITW